MNKKQKIIVSVVGIFIVLLVLVGLTYAYFLTRIKGNTNTKSITVSTTNLEVEYIDGTNDIATASNIRPSNTAVLTKEFSVRNNGDKTNYAVIIENIEIKDRENNTTTLTYPDDFTYTLTCTNSDTTSCGEQSGSFPTSSRGIYYVEIDKGITQSYTLTLYYNETGTDQSADMGKSISAKINITDPATTNPYKTEQNTLKYHILNNSILNLNGTPLVSTPQTQPTQEIYYSSDSYKTKGEESTTAKTFLWYSSYKSRWVVYGTDYEVDEKTGTFTLLNKGVCQYSDSNCITKLVNTDNKNIYVYGASYSYISYTSESTANSQSVTNKSAIYRITNIQTSTNDTVSYKQIYNIPTTIEREMSYTEDEKGTSYYFRGDTKDNYVNFAGKCWRIVRIDGDGNTRLILEDKNTTCNSNTYSGNWEIGTGSYGYKTSNENRYFDYDGCTSDSSTCQKNIMNSWYTSSLSSKQSYLNQESVNIGDTSTQYNYRNDSYGIHYEYETWNRIDSLKIATLEITGLRSTASYIFPITADEVAYAGGVTYFNGYNNKYYIINDYYKSSGSGNFHTISPGVFDEIYDFSTLVAYNGALDSCIGCSDNHRIRPMISLKSSTVYNGGNGTQSNPYQID